MLLSSKLQDEVVDDSLSTLDNIEFVVGDKRILKVISNTVANVIFSEDIINFLNSLSKELLNSRETKIYPDVTTFAFWCRNASIKKMKESYNWRSGTEKAYRLGRGVIFHIAPSNVPVNFAYSMVAGLLAGNANIVRLPSKNFPEVNLICDAVNKVLEKFPGLKQHFVMIRYNHNKDITDLLSQICDTRVIWGGNQTVQTIRNSPLKPRANEICFADRYSICIINPDEYLKIPDKKAFAQKFFNDTYLNDQNACTSPKLVVWLGEDPSAAQDEFWGTLHCLLLNEYELEAIQVVDKLDALYRFGATKQEKYNGKHIPTDSDNYITRIKVATILEDLFENSCNSGFFFEYVTSDLSELLPICNTDLQTIGIFGIPRESILDFIGKYRPRGIDRVVPIGRTLDFDLVWDGYDLINQMSREISILY